ncbi:type II toxin-antitoxin system RelE/ParE family toxin [Flavobacterium sp.]|uniref:type II toxin-antitoxin system RelE/ParE family toxin n=1 Tax=Flavobacterium sp. TaxID=239 RepID=UPI0035AF4544
MSYKIVIEPRAIADIQEAVKFYESRREDLGAYFFQIVDEYIESISKNPFFQIRYKDYHGLPVKIFPYIILYFIDEKEKTIYVLSVFNTSQNTTKYPK